MESITESGLDTGNEESKSAYYILLNGKFVGLCRAEDINKDWVVDRYIHSENAEMDSNGRKFIGTIEDEWTGSIEGYIELVPNWDEFQKILEDAEESTKKAVNYFKEIGRNIITHAIKNIDFLKLKTVWDEERTHINPYSKKHKKMNCGGKTLNKGRSSAQYFSLRSTRKQNTSSVK